MIMGQLGHLTEIGCAVMNPDMTYGDDHVSSDSITEVKFSFDLLCMKDLAP
jgi:hypothetical protein